MNVPDGEDLARRILPMDDYREIRDDMVDIYIEGYRVHPQANEAFSRLSISELQEKAGQNAVAALNYDPTAAITEVQYAYNRLVRWITLTLVAIFLAGVGLGSAVVIAFSQGALKFVSSVSGLLISAVASGSTTIGVIAGLIILYVWSLSASGTVFDVLKEGLVYGPLHFKTRAHSRLVGVTIWNSSLEGSGAVKLLLIFSTLKVLSAVPGWNPYRSIKLKVIRNMDLFVEADGLIDAWKMGFWRLWRKRKENLAKTRKLRGS